MIALAEIRNGYALNKYGNLTLEQISLIKYDDLCLSLIKENKELKEDISFCLHSIKQEMEMSTDSRTRNEMTSCYEILKRWNK